MGKKLTARKHLEAIADALIEAGYDVQKVPKDCDLLDVWGFVRAPGSKRRSKCFEEIYCVHLSTDNGVSASYWSTNQTYDTDGVDIEVLQDDDGLRGVDDLIAALSIRPIRTRKCARCKGKCGNASHRRKSPLGLSVG